MAISFEVTDAERELIEKIAERADRDIFSKYPDIKQTRLDTEMDLCATIAQGIPLRLQELLDADAFNFSHDITGIYRHINRETGHLENCFLPRFYDSSAAKH